MAQLETLRSAAEYAAGFINARGAVPVVRLYDIPNHIREVALHGVCHGAAMALAVAQARSGHKLRLLPHGFLATEHPKDHERLVKDFFNAANSMALASQAEDIVNKVFSGCYLVIGEASKQSLRFKWFLFCPVLMFHVLICLCLFLLYRRYISYRLLPLRVYF